MSLWHHAHPHLRDLVAYEPGKPVEDVARELGLRPEQIIKLASNENPLGPSPAAMQAMRGKSQVESLSAPKLSVRLLNE